MQTIRSIHDDEPAQVICTECSSPMHQVLGGVAITFKGKGFYTTDKGKPWWVDSPSHAGSAATFHSAIFVPHTKPNQTNFTTSGANRSRKQPVNTRVTIASVQLK
jgi:predicted nucleic acid-binding Zn ribbon protein